MPYFFLNIGLYRANLNIMELHVYKHMCMYCTYIHVHRYIHMNNCIWIYIHAHFFFGVGFESALDPLELRPFSVLSFPDELTRRSLVILQLGKRKRE